MYGVTNPRVLVLLTVLVWSVTQTLGRVFSQRSPYTMFALALAVTSLTFLLAIRFGDRQPVWRAMRRLPLRYLAAAPLGYLVYWFALVQCNRAYDTAAEPNALNYTFPVFTVIFTELLFRRHRGAGGHRGREALGVALAFSSVVVLAARGDLLSLEFTNIAGLSWGLAVGAVYGLYSAISSTLDRRAHLPFLLASSLFGAVGMAALAVAFPSGGTLRWRPIDVVLVIIMGAVVEGFGYLTWTAANRVAAERGVSIASVASLIYLLPVISIVIASVVFNETTLFEPYFIVALALLLAGSVLSQGAARR
jgi:drug/metabolite transporter (DMT)-like permease